MCLFVCQLVGCLICQLLRADGQNFIFLIEICFTSFVNTIIDNIILQIRKERNLHNIILQIKQYIWLSGNFVFISRKCKNRISVTSICFYRLRTRIVHLIRIREFFRQRIRIQEFFQQRIRIRNFRRRSDSQLFHQIIAKQKVFFKTSK